MIYIHYKPFLRIEAGNNFIWTISTALHEEDKHMISLIFSPYFYTNFRVDRICQGQPSTLLLKLLHEKKE